MSFRAARRTIRWERGRSRSTATRSRSTARLARAMRASIGTAASYGCIRMLNEDVIDLFDRVAIGAPVMMTP
ncbi:MAG TPA: L,D-transpeptidase [Roseiarcus sp.]|nr:L,D-transpeptidase [Roseiarcus sp.]